ncbi:MAG: pilus (MSHA type) biogenesis protein MshL [Gammaproteobacteria bacterium]|nr:pilus (MSHA type) biogenesis protein MshL [Gammaproteobacteria bacterium]
MENDILNQNINRENMVVSQTLKLKDRISIPALFVLMIMVGLLTSCATDKERKSNTMSSITDAFEESSQRQAEAPTEDNVADALLPPISLELPGDTQIDVEPRFDIKVNRALAKQFFMGLVEGTAHNMVVHPSVKGRITLDLKNVSVPEVMDVVRSVYGYDFEQTKSGYQVFPNEMSTRIFKVNYLDIKRKGSSQMRISSGQVTEANLNQSGSSSSQLNTGNSQISGTGNRSSVSGSRIETSSDSSFWKELHLTLQTILGNREGRSVVVSPQSGIVVIRAMPGELRTIEKFLATTQNIIERQVILEAKIVEVELSENFQAGINWSALKTTPNSSVLASQTGGGSIFDGTGSSVIDGNTGDLNPSSLSQITGSAASAFGGVFSLALNIRNDFTAFLELLKTQGDVQVLSSPKVSTINNQKAVIKVGKDEFFITDVESDTNIATGASTTTSNVELTPFFSGVALDVIPQISEDGDIILHIHPSVSTVTEKVKNIGLSSSSTLSVPLAISTIRESDSIIKAKNGQVVVIGGLMQDSISEEDASVPVLGDLPLIGALFRHSKEVKKKSELVILLKPIVVDNDIQWSDAVQKSQQRINMLYGN